MEIIISLKFVTEKYKSNKYYETKFTYLKLNMINWVRKNLKCTNVKSKMEFGEFKFTQKTN